MQLFPVNIAIGQHRYDLELGSFPQAGLLPRDKGRMVVGNSGDHFVSGVQQRGKAAGDQVDGLGGAPGEEDAVPFIRIHIRGYVRSGFFVGGGGFLAEVVDAPMDVAIDSIVELHQGIQDLLRLLGGSRIVQIGQRIAVNRLFQYREIFSYVIGIHVFWLAVGLLATSEKNPDPFGSG